MAFTIPAASSRPDSPSGNGNENGEGRRKDESKGHSKRLCSEWLVSYESNFSVAKDREWFTTYTPFDSYVLDHKGVLMEVFGIGSVTLPVKCSNRFDDNNPTQLTLHDVLHVPKAVCNLVSRHDRALGRQELWTLPSEEDPYNRGVFQHQQRHRRSKSNEPEPGLDGDVNVCAYMLPNSGSPCLLDLDMDRPPTGYALAHTSFPVYTDGSPRMLMDTYSGDLIPLTWPDNQSDRWNRKRETGDDDSMSRTITTNTGPSMQTSELVKRLMDQRAGLISQLRSLDMLIDEVQGVTPAATASVNNNADTTRPMTTTVPNTSMASSYSVVTPAATASIANSDTTPTPAPADASTTPSIPGAAVDNSGVCCHEWEEDNTQTPEELVRTAIEEEAKAEKDSQWETQSEKEVETTMADDKVMVTCEVEQDEIMVEYDDIEDEVMAEVMAEYEDEDGEDGGVIGQEEIAAPSGSAAKKAPADSPNWVPLSSIGLKVVCEPDNDGYTDLVIVTLPGGSKTKEWSYDKMKKKRLSEEDKAWLRGVSKYTPHFFEWIGYNADTDTWEPERGEPMDRAHARTLVKWLRVHARPPLSYGGEIRIDLDTGILNDRVLKATKHALEAATERLRVLRAAGREPSPEATRELNFIHKTTLRLRSELNKSYKDAPNARIWSYKEVFGK